MIAPIPNTFPPILLVDDDPVVLQVSSASLQSQGISNVLTLDDSSRLLQFLQDNAVSVIILDLMMPHLSGMELLPSLNSEFPLTPVIIMTSLEEIDTAVSCMKAGAFDFLTKPVQTARLVSSVEKALQVNELSRQNSSLREHLLDDCLEHPEAFENIITASKKMRAIFQYIEVIAKSDQPVLVTGETGVGKELVARAIHGLSGRNGAFVPVNVAGLDDNMFSDTLFGHKKGAFTGADQSREGLISTAVAGTLFLDEIGDLNEFSQVKLLRLIQEQEYYPVGSDVLKKTDARLIVATNQDLARMISAGKFRKDLYYRLYAHHINVPALRERREDIPVLLDHFLGKAAKSLGKAKPAPSTETVALLSTFHFEGNVRELEAMTFDAVARHRGGMLSLESVLGQNKAKIPADSAPSSEQQVNEVIYELFGGFPTIKAVEDYLISAAMNMTNGNQRSAASLLGIARQTLSKRLSNL